MKRLQIMIDEDLDEALARVAAAQGVSKAALIRRAVRESYMTAEPPAVDPLEDLIGAADFEPADIDEVVYG